MLRDHWQCLDARSGRELLAQRFREIGHLREVAGASLVNPAEELRRAETLFTQPFAKRGQSFQIEVEQVGRRHRVGCLDNLSVRRR